MVTHPHQTMKAVVVNEYGGPEVLKFDEMPNPIPGPGEVLVRMSATSFNPFDLKRRSGVVKDYAPIQFPGILGVDLSGTIVELGEGVTEFVVGDDVFGMADRTYAELCAVKASSIAKIPEGVDRIGAAALPLVTTTGNQLISVGTEIKAGQTVLVTGALGNVGRSAVFTANDIGAVVIAGVLRHQIEQAKDLGVDRVIATDDADAIVNLPALDAVADTVNGKTAEELIAKIKPGGVFATVVAPPQNAKSYPEIKVVPVSAQPNPETLLYMTQAVINGKLTIPVGRRFPLHEAAQVHAEAGKIPGKVLLVPGQL